MFDTDVTHVARSARLSSHAKYWTGRILGRWPEYLSSPERALKMPKECAKLVAAELNELCPGCWKAVPAPV